jgi:hypothetical protein
MRGNQDDQRPSARSGWLGRHPVSAAITVGGLLTATAVAAVAAATVIGDGRPATAGPGTASAPAPLTATGTDPLTPNETSRAVGLATGNARGAGEMLFAERHERGKGREDGQRRADVYLYDYRTDSTLRRVVNLDHARVEETGTTRGSALPPSRNESARAAGIVLADGRLGPGLRETFQRATGRPLSSPDQLQVQGMLFTRGRQAAPQCTGHRCVQLFVRVPGGKWIDTSRIVVDLSAGRAHVISR